MSSTLDVTAVNAVLKARYTKKKCATISFTDRPFFAEVGKDTNGGGANWTIPIRNALPQTRSITFGNSQASTTYAPGPSSYKNWVLTWFSDYATANIGGVAIDEANGSENAMVDIVTNETDGAMDNLSNACAVALYHNGGGSR